MNKTVMKSSLSFFSIYFLYWIALCWFDRTVFLINNWGRFEEVSDIFYAYLFGLRMDLSLTSYILVVPFLFFIVQNIFIQKSISPWFLRIYTLIPTVIFGLITLINLPLYEAWGEKISKRAILLGLGTVGGVSSSIDMGMIIHAAIIMAIFFLIAHFFYHKLVVRFAVFQKATVLTSFGYLIFGSVLLFSFIRGGYGRATLNPSAVYFSDNNPSNHLAVNTYWAFLKDLMKNSLENPYQFMDQELADELTQVVLPGQEVLESNVLKSNRPNVVLVILEGMVAQVFENLGGETGVTNHMKSIMEEGVNFTRAYSAADRSDKGMIGIMSGFPSQGTESIIQYIHKHERLASISSLYDSLGYSTSFYHGGQSEFYNFKSFMYAHGVNRVVDSYNFPLDIQRNSWGVYDHVVAERMLEDLKDEKQPFFSIFYTLVNHEPFTLSEGYKYGNKTKADAYRSTAYYTDTMFNNLVNAAKKQAWYDNTVFVVVSDHGSIYPAEKYGLEHPNRYHIPLFIFGGALSDKYKGKVLDYVVSQLDIASTLWNFLSTEKSPFKYSSDLFAKNRKNYVFFNSNNTFGVVTNDQAVSFDMQGEKVAFVQNKSLPVDSVIELNTLSKAYYQSVFQDFLKY